MSNTMTLWHCDIPHFAHCGIVTFRTCDIPHFAHCGIVTFRTCDIPHFAHCGIVTFRTCDIPHFAHCDKRNRFCTCGIVTFRILHTVTTPHLNISQLLQHRCNQITQRHDACWPRKVPQLVIKPCDLNWTKTIWIIVTGGHCQKMNDRHWWSDTCFDTKEDPKAARLMNLQNVMFFGVGR